MEIDLKSYFANVIKKRNEDIQKVEDELKELEAKNETCEDEEELKRIGDDAEALKAKIATLKEELAQAEAQLAEIDNPADKQPDEEERKKQIKNMEVRKNMNKEELQKRAKAFYDSKRVKFSNEEVRSTLISGGTIATPTEVGGINDQFNYVSSIVDLVKVVNCEGMGAYKVAYQSAESEASTQTEGNLITPSDPTFAYVTISPTSYAVLSYISKQVEKQSPLNYFEKVNKNAKDALRAKASAIIVNAIKASTLNVAVNATIASAKGVIDEKTLRNMVLNYGGDENVMGNAVLFLNKTDLIAFGDVRGTNDKKPVYEITPDQANPNTGVIKDGGLAVKYCINSNLTACHNTSQGATDTITMIYGNPHNFELGLFSDYEVEVSSDYKFAENMLAIRGDVEMGGDVVVKDGFVKLVIAHS